MLITNNSVSSDYVCLYDFFKDKEIGIPIFQRFFDWKTQQTEEILKDILAAIQDPQKTIYLLDFIYYDEDEKIKLADGQQRIVSINSLIKAINDVIDEQQLNIAKEKLFKISYDINANDTKYQNSFNNYPIAPFKKVYLHLKKFVEDNLSDISNIIHVIKEQIYIYVKKCSSADDAFLIFQQINTGGKPLTKDEIIKTSIDQYSDVYGIPVSANIKELKIMIASYYKFLMPNSDGNFDNIAIMSFLKDHVVKTHQSFQKFVNALNVVAATQSCSISYVIKYINRAQLLDIINVMSMKGINIDTNKIYLTKVMAPLCLLSICMSIKKSNPGGIIKSLYNKVVNMIKKGDSVSNIALEIVNFINNNASLCKLTYKEFEDALGDKNVPQGIKKGLLILDVILRSTSSSIIVDNINLEHIYPQKPHSDWALNGWPSNHDEQMDLILNIGNFLLLNEEINKKIKNKYITLKVYYYNQIIPNDLSLQTPINTVDFSKFENDKKKYIIERQKAIATMIKNTFPIAQVLIN